MSELTDGLRKLARLSAKSDGWTKPEQYITWNAADRIDELESKPDYPHKEIDELIKQRDELAAALRLAKAGIPTTSWVGEK